MSGWNRWEPSESDEQICVFEWAAVMQPKVPELQLLFHIPNGGYRNKATAARMKAEGVKAGVPDLFLPVARNGAHGLFIEMKKRKGGKVREEQYTWGKALTFEGYQFTICRGADDAIGCICDYLGVKELGMRNEKLEMRNEKLGMRNEKLGMRNEE